MGILNRTKTVAEGCLAYLRLCMRHGLRVGSLFRVRPVWMCTYPQVLSLVETTTDLPGALIDIGANNSQFARLLKALVPEMQVLSFEPSLECNPIGEVHRVALSDENSKGTLFWKDRDTAGGALAAGSATGTDRTLEVEVRRFDSLGIDPGALPRPVLVKVDTQGHELRAIKGFGESLGAVDHVIAEVQGVLNADYSQGALFAHMETRGFTQSQVLFAHTTVAGRPDYMDVMWSRK